MLVYFPTLFTKSFIDELLYLDGYALLRDGAVKLVFILVDFNYLHVYRWFFLTLRLKKPLQPSQDEAP